MRGGIREPNGSIFTARSRGSTTRCGSIAAPRSSATRAPSVPLSSVRKTTFSSGTRPARNRSGSSVVRRPISGSFATSRSGRRRVELRELRAGGDEQDVRILQHLCPLERPVAQRQVGEGQVELAVLEQPQEVGGGALLPHADADERPLLAEAAHEGGEEAGADALVDADAKRSRRALGERGHVGAGRVEARDDRVGVAEQEEPGLGRLHAPRAAGAVEEPLPDDPLELRDLLADGRLRIAELARRAAEGARCARPPPAPRDAAGRCPAIH